MLLDARAVVFTGKGGVGKTTTAAAFALDRCREERVLLLSTDPAHSLGDLFPALPPNGGAPHVVGSGDLGGRSGGLAIETLDARQKTDDFRSRHGEMIQDIVRKGTFFGDEDIARVLQMSLPGMDEVMAFLRLAELLEVSESGSPDGLAPPDELEASGPGASGPGAFDRAQDIDRVVVDTAPTGHTLRLVDMPGRFATWLDVLDGMLEKHRTMRAAFGGSGPDPMEAFLDDMYARVDRVSRGLQNASTIQAVVVTRAEPLVRAETERLLDALSGRGITVGAVILNGCSGPAAEIDDRTSHAGVTRTPGPSPESSTVDASIPAPVHRGDVSAYLLPYDPALTSPDAGDRRSALENAWSRLREIPDSGAQPSGGDVELPQKETSPRWTVEAPAPLPEARVIMVAGKGGVGKTTIACATALRLASSVRGTSMRSMRGADDTVAGQRLPLRQAPAAEKQAQPRILLASTDPAHSLADVFSVERSDVDPSSPTQVAPGLDVLEIDAASRFSALRDRYRDEVRAAFHDVGGSHVDLPFDRAVTESMLDLAPPGIDEVMGWVAVMEFVRRDDYHACVIDTAPTGHFQQLVDMPERFAEWTRAMFQILRSHRDVLHLPTVTDRLVRLSKQTKRWRQMQANGQIQVVAVTRPEPVVQSETLRLAQYLQKQSMQIHCAVMNAVTPPDDRTSAEQDLIETFRSTLHATPDDRSPDNEASNGGSSKDRTPDGDSTRPGRPLPVPLVHRYPGPRPTASLTQLGRALYV